MTLSRKLEQWLAAGLIDEETAARIAEHERSRSRPIAAWALAGLGATTVGTGVVSVVAANWDGIPGWVKLGVDLLIAAALATGILVAVRRGYAWAREILVLLYYLFTLASIALVGQVAAAMSRVESRAAIASKRGPPELLRGSHARRAALHGLVTGGST